MKKVLLLGLLTILLGSAAFAQDSKAWTDWSKGDAEKLLNKSAWGQSLMKGEAPPDMRTRNNAGSPNPSLGDPGPIKVPSEIYLRVRFLTAKPIREAFASRVLIAQPDASAELKGRLQSFIDEGFGDFIVIGVNVEGQNPQTVAPTMRALMQLKTEDLAEKAYLERKDGKRLPILEYKTPVNDEMGGKFVFARTVDGQPFFTPDADTVRFVLNLSGNLKFNMKFDVGKMTYGDRLEF